MKRQLFAFVLVAVLVSGVTAYAHHSFTSTYYDDKTVKIEGKIVQFQFRNPHSFVTIEAPDEKGEVQRWGVEWGGATQLGGQGVTRYTLKAGDVVVITGRPGRTSTDHRILMRSLLRKADGFGWGAKDGEVVD
jgi:hypothetical protein